MPLAPPPPITQDVTSRQFRDWFYSIYAILGQPGQTLGTMAYENANSVAITGGSIGGVGISGSNINSTPIGTINPSTGKFTDLSSSGAVSGTGFTNYFASPPSLGSTTPNTGKFTSVTDTGLTTTRVTYAGAGGLLKDSANLTFDGTTLVSTGLQGPIGVTTPNSGAFTSNLTRDTYTVKPNCYIEAYDRSATIALTATPTLLIPNSTIAGSTGITYDNTTGVFTFAEEGDYSLSLSVNALASSANQVLYIYAENNTGAGWVANANSGKYYTLTNGNTIQIIYSQSVHRVANQQVRYWIYATSTNVSLKTQTLPSVTGVYVPAIRIQYS
ncbi:hypothetical protein UFOVP146_23 [uncultured Caudovirales phage]|uniref:C1q domain containing protein n=1 Tax=uncultured Caudovirales phage TaxID=2100421 RepID=A0A6J7VKW6_9CAUD|nr:hypothetical protein UFOVP146_23 [uncultured Caudovirales phage]